MSYRKLWIALGLVVTISFAVLGGVGIKVLKSAPPIPSQVVTTDGRVLFDGATIQDGQGAWQSIGGQEVGTIWGHGAYVAPDWTADWLHRECVFILDHWAKNRALPITLPWVSSNRRRCKRASSKSCGTTPMIRPPARSRSIPFAPQAFDELYRYYSDVFSRGRDDYAIQPNALSDPVKLRQMSAFFWWTAWAASTEPPGHRRHLHPELAARTADRQSADGRRHRVERHQLRVCCWPAWAAWSGISPRSRGRLRKNSCRKTIRCWASGRRLRSAPP